MPLTQLGCASERLVHSHNAHGCQSRARPRRVTHVVINNDSDSALVSLVEAPLIQFPSCSQTSLCLASRDHTTDS
jgi:hypothetical protein